MLSASVSSESLQFLLKHIEANRRFEISNRCPALREFEKSVPLHITSLGFMKGYVIVNDTSYSLSIIRKYNEGVFENRIWAQHEVDRYGFEDKSDDTTLTPGDVELKHRRRVLPRTDDENMMRHENSIQADEARLADLLERRPNGSQSVVDEKKMVARVRDYHYRRDNIPPNYEHVLQLTTW